MSQPLNIPIRDKDTDISTEVARGKHFEKFLHEHSVVIADKVGDGDSLNEEIAQLAKRESLNRLQIQRFVEEVNTLSFNVRYKAKSGDRDRRISFELAEVDKVLNYMGDDAPGEIVNPNFPNGFIEPVTATESSFDKVASTLHEFGKKENQVTEEDRRAEIEYLRKEASIANKYYKEEIAKIGNVLIQNERRMKNSNEIFNTLIDDVGLNKKAASDIINSVQGGVSYLKRTQYIPSDFEINLEVSPIEKKAHNVFGEHSLLKKTASYAYEKPEVLSHNYAKDYDELVKIAHSLMSHQRKILEYTEVI